jgi:hypothetical protein
MSFDEAITKVTEKLGQEGFGVLTEINHSRIKLCRLRHILALCYRAMLLFKSLKMAVLRFLQLTLPPLCKRLKIRP